MDKRILVSILGLAVAAQAADAATFEIDYRGAKPKSFRMTALCKGNDHFISPEPYKSTLFSSEGNPIMGHGTGLFLGTKDGKDFLVLDGFGSGKNVIVGTANNLDDIRPLEGVLFKGYQEWDMLNHAWRLKIETGSAKLADFDGERMDIPKTVDRLLANIRAGGKVERPENLKVLMSFLTHYFHYYGPNEEYSQNPAQHFFAKVKSDYVDRVTAAAGQMQGEQRRLLSQLNEEVLGAAEATLAGLQKSDIKYPKMIEVLKMSTKAIGDLQASLEK